MHASWLVHIDSLSAYSVDLLCLSSVHSPHPVAYYTHDDALGTTYGEVIQSAWWTYGFSTHLLLSFCGYFTWSLLVHVSLDWGLVIPHFPFVILTGLLTLLLSALRICSSETSIWPQRLTRGTANHVCIYLCIALTNYRLVHYYTTSFK